MSGIAINKTQHTSHRRFRRQKSHTMCCLTYSGCFIIICNLFLLYNFYRIYILPIQKSVKKDTNNFQKQNGFSAKSQQYKFLVYRPPVDAGQGVGNRMQGLLAAHLLGIEFNRTVCVSKNWKDFFIGFIPQTSICVDAEFEFEQQRGTRKNSLWVIDFGKYPINECDLYNRLASDERILYFIANTYPRWPPITRYKINLLDYYLPMPNIQRTLVPTVVHLRQPDGIGGDIYRKGLELETLIALGRSLPKSTYLVTNQVEYYDFFQSNYGWLHPNWTIVQHSALGMVWSDKNKVVKSPAVQARTEFHFDQVTQMWSDWLTLWQAHTVFHTASAFSLSATLWNPLQLYSSFTILGVNTSDSSLLLLPWTTETNHENESLINRSPGEMENCDLHPSGLDGVSFVFDLDDDFQEELIIQ